MPGKIQRCWPSNLARAPLWPGAGREPISPIENLSRGVGQRPVSIRLRAILGRAVCTQSNARVVFPAVDIRFHDRAWNVVDTASLVEPAACYQLGVDAIPGHSRRRAGMVWIQIR